MKLMLWQAHNTFRIHHSEPSCHFSQHNLFSCFHHADPEDGIRKFMRNAVKYWLVDAV